MLGNTSGALPAGLVADGYQSTYGGGSYDAFIVRLNAALTARRAGTYLGGSGIDLPYALAVAPDGGSVYLAGLNSGGAFPTVNEQQSTYAGSGDGFVSRLSTDLTAINRIPNPVTFIAQSNVPAGSLRTSNEVHLTVTPTPRSNQPAYLSGQAGSQICATNTPGCCTNLPAACSGFVSGWFSEQYSFLSGDYIAVRHNAASPSGTAVTNLITGGVAFPFVTSTGNAAFKFNLDMNADNTLSATAEGLILLRAMLGFSGTAVTAGTGIATPWSTWRVRSMATAGRIFSKVAFREVCHVE